MQQAEWNDITWGSETGRVANISSITLSQGIKIDEQESESGINQQTIKGLEAEKLTLNYKAGLPLGVDPRGEYEVLEKCGGKQADFILNDKKLSDKPFTLDGVSLSETIIDDFGRILVGSITLELSTDSQISSAGGKATKKGTASRKSKTSSLTLKPEDIAKAKALK